MIRLETTAKIFLNIRAEHIKDAEVAKILLEVEQQFNSIGGIGVIRVDKTLVGVRVHVSGDMPKYDKSAPKKRWETKAPEKCDGCGDILETYFIDGKTIFGPWAIMCENCHTTHGVGLGIGLGQKYDLKTLEKIAG